MTLVITEVSERFECIVVGDSAVTVNGTQVVLGAEKVHYSDKASIGFAIWGNACLSGRRVDELVSSFVEGLPSTASPRSAGHDLAAFLTSEGEKDGRSWNALRGGVHVCGYQGSSEGPGLKAGISEGEWRLCLILDRGRAEQV
jgi:hypothetical protein